MAGKLHVVVSLIHHYTYSAFSRDSIGEISTKINK